MLFISFYRYIIGYIKFKINGRFSERFFNLLNQNNIAFWDVTRDKDGVYGYMFAYNYKNVRKFVKKTNIEIEICEKTGLFFKTKRYKNRKGIYIGILIICFMFFISSKLVLTIDVEGNKTVDSERILQVVEEEGFKIGSMYKREEINNIQQKALLKIPELSFLAINVMGLNAVIDVKERTIAPEVQKIEGEGNLIASENAIISKTEVYGGITSVKKGDVVLKGDLLVSGFGEKQDGGIVNQKAWGKVFGLVEVEKEFKKEFTQRVKTQERITKNYIYQVFGFKVPIIKEKNINSDDDVKLNRKPLKVFGFKVPIMENIQEIKKTKKEDKTFTKEEIIKQLDNDIIEYEKNLNQEEKVKDKNIEVIENENEIIYKIKFIIEKNIAQFQEIK